MATACFGLVTFFPLRPLRSFPRFISCISVFTCCPAFGPYLRLLDLAGDLRADLLDLDLAVALLVDRLDADLVFPRLVDARFAARFVVLRERAFVLLRDLLLADVAFERDLERDFVAAMLCLLESSPAHIETVAALCKVGMVF